MTGPGDHSVAWSIGNRGSIEIIRNASNQGGNFEGVDLILGTAAAASSADTTDMTIWSVGATNPITDDWTLRGWADVAILDEFKSDPAPHKFVLEDDAKLSFDQTTHGDFEVLDSAALTSYDGFYPNSLVIDSGSVTGVRVGPFFQEWTATMLNGATLTSGSGGGFAGTISFLGTHRFFPNSVLTYRGTGNTIEGEGIIIGGELVRSGHVSTLDVEFMCAFVVETETVRVVGGSTVITPVDAEHVSVEAIGHTLVNWIEAFGPDYEGHNPDGVLFTDSPCVRRWENFTVQAGTDDTGISDEACSTPISGRVTPFCSGPPAGGVIEALYVMDLEVASGATLVAGEPVRDYDINIYYTGTLTNNGTIEDTAGSTYAPVQLTPTIYGDFNGDGDGDEPDVLGSDTRRFNDAFCTCIGQASYDILVDWNCDGVVDDLDHDQYNANWDDPSGVTTDACTGDPCS